MFSFRLRHKPRQLSRKTNQTWSGQPSGRNASPSTGYRSTKQRPTIFGTVLPDRVSSDAESQTGAVPQMTGLSQLFSLTNGYTSSRPDLTESLVYKDGNLISGSVEALSQLLIPSHDYFPERTYVFAYLLSSRLFLSPATLLQTVCQQCIKALDQRANEESVSKLCENCIRLLGEWMEMFPADFREERMIKQTKDLTSKVTKLCPDLREKVGIIMHHLFTSLSNAQKYEEILDKRKSECKERLLHLVPTTDILNLCDNPLTLAEQLTHIELERLENIGAEEFVQAFARDELKRISEIPRATYLEVYVNWFNRLSYLVATEICMHLKKKQRARVIEYFIDVAKECFNIGNFNSLMAIIAGLNMSQVSRLKRTWNKLNTDKFDVLVHQMEPNNNFVSYRSTLKAALWRAHGAHEKREKIVIPFFSLLVKDLYFLNEGCSTKLPNGHVNFEKCWHMAKQVTEFISWKQVECPFVRHDTIINYLLTSPVFSEASLSLASFECEGPENSYERERHKNLKFCKLASRTLATCTMYNTSRTSDQ